MEVPRRYTSPQPHLTSSLSLNLCDLRPHSISPRGRCPCLPIATMSAIQHDPLNSNFLRTFYNLISGLPSTIPQTACSDQPSPFAAETASIDNTSLEKDELWEDVLNSFLKAALGWSGDNKGLSGFVRHGDGGIVACYCFALYFIEK